MSKNTPAMTIKRTSRATLHPYEATTRGIRIRVEPHYMEEQSSPEDSHFVWSYAVEIINDGDGNGAAAGRASGGSPTRSGAPRKCADRASSARRPSSRPANRFITLRDAR